MKNSIFRRLVSLTLTLALLLTAMMPAALADSLALRVWCNNIRVSTGVDGLPTGLMFNIGAQFGTESYTYTYALTGPAAKSGSASAGVNNIIGDFAPGAYSLNVSVKDAAGATASTTVTFTYVVSDDHKGSVNNVSGATGVVEIPEVKVEKITLTPESMSLRVGAQGQFTPTIAPENADNRTVQFESSSPGIASVDGTGLVTALQAGTALITCRAKDGSGVVATASVTVVQTVTGISMTPAAMTMAVQDTKQLNVTVSPDNAANKKVSYSSSNPAVASVSSSGLVMAVSQGVATITVTSEDDSNKKATCVVTVGVPVSSITLALKACTLDTGASTTLLASVLPADATNPALLWSSSDTDVATVTSKGVISAWKAGTAVITVKAADGNGASATCTVTVTVT